MAGWVWPVTWSRGVEMKMIEFRSLQWFWLLESQTVNRLISLEPNLGINQNRGKVGEFDFFVYKYIIYKYIIR